MVIFTTNDALTIGFFKKWFSTQLLVDCTICKPISFILIVSFVCSKLIPYTRMHELCFEDMKQTSRMLMFPHFCLTDGKVGLMCGIGLRCVLHIYVAFM